MSGIGSINSQDASTTDTGIAFLLIELEGMTDLKLDSSSLCSRSSSSCKLSAYAKSTSSDISSICKTWHNFLVFLLETKIKDGALQMFIFGMLDPVSQFQ